MDKQMKFRFRKKSGFTIIELIVVIVVIGILAALVVVAYNGIINQAKESSLVSDMKNAKKVLGMYKVDYGYFPENNDCSIPESPSNICLKTSPNNSIDYQSDGDTYTMYGSIAEYPFFFKATEEIEAKKFTDWRQISAGYYHTCGIYYNGKVYCWGRGFNGQLGNSVNTDKNSPVAVSAGAIGSQTIKSISSGGFHTCAIAIDKKAYCWGGGSSGQLGNSFNTDKNSPVAVSAGAIGIQTIKSISSGETYTCAIASDSKVYCWGYNNYGQLGNSFSGFGADKNSPVAVSVGAIGSQTIKSISSGQTHTCAIASDSKAYCWGSGSSGQLGNSFNTDKNSPVAVSAGAISSQTIKSISSGWSHTCAIASDSKAYCWGSGGSGQLGNGFNVAKNSPVAVSAGDIGSQTIKTISSGVNHTCVIASDSKAYCWGRDNYGQLGNSFNLDKNSPVAVSAGDIGSQTINYIRTYGDYTCAIASDSKAYCWGRGNYGQLGNGFNVDQNLPVLVNKP